MEDDWISVKEASEILGVSQETVRRRADTGDIRSWRTRPGKGGWRKVSRTSVEEYKRKMLAPGGTEDSAT